MREVGELELIRRIGESAAWRSAVGVRVGIGDDTAVLGVTPGSALLATTDLIVEDVHFRRAWASPRDIGWKAMAVNLSDIAAMGGLPRWALVALAVPPDTAVEAVEAFYAGMQEAATPHGVAIVGGDTSASPAGWFVNVTLLGVHPGEPKLRSQAQPGDAVAVTGALGASAAGLHVLETGADRARGAGLGSGALEELATAHLRPTARVAEGRWLGAAPGVHAMLDCSDGLATDLGHICRASGVGARVRLDRVPVHPAAAEAGRVLGADARRWAAGGGEDYELLITCDPAAVAFLAAGLREATGTALTAVGQVDGSQPGVLFVDASGAPVGMPAGFEHFRG